MRTWKVLLCCGAALASGCTSVQGPPQILNAQGTVRVQAGNPDNPANLEENFRQAALAVFQSPNVLGEAQSTAAELAAFKRSGFALVYARCNDYFWRMGQNQTRARVARDAIAPIITVLTGIISLRDFTSNPGREQELLQMLTLGSAFATSGLDIYDTHFLFGAENINSVRVLTFNALATHRAGVDALSVTSAEQAAIHLIDHQAICTPPNILALARDAIARGELEQTIAGGGVGRRDLDWRRSLGNELGVPGQLSAEQSFALWWLFASGEELSSNDLASIKGLLGSLPAEANPLEETGTPPSLALKGTWSHREDILRLLDSIPAATRAVYVARLPEERASAAAPSDLVNAAPGAAPPQRRPRAPLVPVESGDGFQRVGVRVRN